VVLPDDAGALAYTLVRGDLDGHGDAARRGPGGRPEVEADDVPEGPANRRIAGSPCDRWSR
jgi:hypothetical protein